MTTETLSFLEARLPVRPRVGVVLGSGLGGFAEGLANQVEIPYAEIPGFPHSTAIGHAGKLVVGSLGALPVAVLSGRAHLYEGYTPQQVVYGVRTLGLLGVQCLVLTNAAGGIRTAFAKGSLVLIADHINLLGANPLAGPNDESLGPRFPDMTEAYSVEYRELAQQVAREQGFRLPEGVYAAVPGPSYETPAEIHYLRTIGADLVGMSTVPEVIAANHMGLKVLGISCVTNPAAGILPEKLNHGDVLEVGRQVRARLFALLAALLPRLEARQDG